MAVSPRRLETARRVSPRVDQEAQRTLFAGVIAAFVVYGMGLAAGPLLGGETGFLVGNVLILLSLVFALGWAVAVWRGFRLGGPGGRSARRRKERERR